MSTVKIHESWKNVLGDEFSKTYMEDLRAFLKKRLNQEKKFFLQ
jgi:uracil DNA glycosylase